MTVHKMAAIVLLLTATALAALAAAHTAPRNKHAATPERRPADINELYSACMNQATLEYMDHHDANRAVDHEQECIRAIYR